MASPDLSDVRVVYCDLYSTLLEVTPTAAAADEAETAWRELWCGELGGSPEATLRQFTDRTRTEIARRHAEGRAKGLVRPEVDWREVVRTAEPAVRDLPRERLDSFLLGHARLERQTRLMPGAAAGWRKMAAAGCRLGILSNAQAVSRQEWADALGAAGESDPFEPALSFFSYEHGIAKPDPAFYALAEAAAGVEPGRLLMVGDRLDNDIAPTRARGWQTWRLAPGPVRRGGDWSRLAAAFG